jgi:NADH-quinone oxidoreductase subunit M
MHMGYCFLGLVTFDAIGVGGAVILMFGHGLSVALMFMLSTAVFHRTQTYDMKEMGGLASRTPILAGMFVAATFASIGLPGFANFWGEFALFVALWNYNPWVLAGAALGIVISAIYGLRAVAWIFFGKPSEALKELWKEHKPFELRQGERLAATLLFSGLLIVGFFPRIFSDYVDMDLESFAPPAADAQTVSADADVASRRQADDVASRRQADERVIGLTADATEIISLTADATGIIGLTADATGVDGKGEVVR